MNAPLNIVVTAKSRAETLPTPAQLRQRADRALYLAKHAGGARTSLG